MEMDTRMSRLSFEKMIAIMAKETLVTFPISPKNSKSIQMLVKATIRSLHLTRWQASSILLWQASTSTNLLYYRTQVTFDSGNTQRISKYIAGPKD
jgi:hypothetical protein